MVAGSIEAEVFRMNRDRDASSLGNLIAEVKE
jgi:hypothetical protein